MGTDQEQVQKLSYALGKSSVGTVLLAKSERGVSAVFLGSDPDQLVKSLQQQFPCSEISSDNLHMARLLSEVITFIERPQSELKIPLDIQGTAFQKIIWHELQQIAPGTTLSYSELARKIGRPTAVRAIANACAANKLAVLIPCHRVIRSDGGLAGYRWGEQRKQQLLQREVEQHISTKLA